MSKLLTTLTVAGGLASLVGIGAGVYGITEACKEKNAIPEMRETIKQEYLDGNKTLEEYTLKMEEYATTDANAGGFIVACAAWTTVAAIAAGVFGWATKVAIEEF